MGIHGIFKEIGPGRRISLAKFSSDHLVAHNRPLRLAIDISIWLFQIQAGKGGANPALRTFYYRLLRLLSLNIHPLFVFDGPNKPLFKRNKKVGGPGVRVASVPEFLAKQLLKQFGFPWHVAPGEAEAECALFQREGIVDAVLSEDVDTLMFGSGVTLKNWSSENTSKTPTHVNVYRTDETVEGSGIDREGMILVALMSGGDYIPEGIPGCGPKVACDAARAGYGKDLCAIRRNDAAGFATWREKLQHQIRTNEGKLFSRKNTKMTIPDDFPNLEVLGYYTQPCVSTSERLIRLREEFRWDQAIDFPALRSFTADAFDWRCRGGAKKFIRTLAPAMLVRETRLLTAQHALSSREVQGKRELEYISAIHGKRNHSTTDGELEYRISFIPMHLVPIDLSVEEDDDEFIPAGGTEDLIDVDGEFPGMPGSTAADGEPSSPTKKRLAEPYEPDQPEKLWMLHSFLKLGCPLLLENYHASLLDPKEFFRQRRKARAVATGSNAKQNGRKKKQLDPQAGAILQYGTVAKPFQISASEAPSSQEKREPLGKITHDLNARVEGTTTTYEEELDATENSTCSFKPPSLQIPASLQKEIDAALDHQLQTPKASRRGVTSQRSTTELSALLAVRRKQPDQQNSPRGRKRLSDEAVSPALSQKTIDSYWSPSQKLVNQSSNVIDLVSPSPSKLNAPRSQSPTPRGPRSRTVQTLHPVVVDDLERLPALPESVTKRKKRGPLRRIHTAPPERLCEVETMSSSPCVVSSVLHAIDAEVVGSGDLAGTLPIPQEMKGFPRPVISVGQVLPLRRSPRQEQVKKQRIQLRESLEGAWKLSEVEELDLSGDGSGWKHSRGKARLPGWRQSGVEVLDLTGA